MRLLGSGLGTCMAVASCPAWWLQDLGRSLGSTACRCVTLGRGLDVLVLTIKPEASKALLWTVAVRIQRSLPSVGHGTRCPGRPHTSAASYAAREARKTVPLLSKAEPATRD